MSDNTNASSLLKTVKKNFSGKQTLVYLFFGLIMSILVSACGSTQKIKDSSSPYDPSSNVSPTAKEVLQFIIRNHDIPLTIHDSCNGVGTDFDDRTIGDYISGFLAELTGQVNSVIVSCSENTLEVNNRKIWRCEVLFAHSDNEDEWRWGVRFDIDQHTGEFIRNSVRCIGMG